MLRGCTLVFVRRFEAQRTRCGRLARRSSSRTRGQRWRWQVYQLGGRPGRRLGGADELRREDLAVAEHRPRDSAAWAGGLRVLERGAARCADRRCDVVSPGHRSWQHVGSGPARAGGIGYLGRGARFQHDVGQRADLLVAGDQYAARSALGTFRGVVQRGSLPHGQDGRGFRARLARRRPEVPQGRVHAQALRWQQLRVQPARWIVGHRRAVVARILPAGLRSRRGRGGCLFGHVRLQQRERRAVGRQSAALAQHPSRHLGLQGLRGVGLRRRVGHRQQSSLHVHHDRSCGHGPAGGHRSELR